MSGSLAVVVVSQPTEVLGTKPGSLQEQCMHLSIEPSLQPLNDMSWTRTALDITKVDGESENSHEELQATEGCL